MDTIKWMLMILMLFTALSVCRAQSWVVNVAMEQDIVIPCGVQVKGPFERLVWKLGDVNSTEDLAHSFDGSISCDRRKKQNCSLRSDGSLELHNVQETDSNDYFCVLDIEKYYSQHTLVVHPEVAFKICPNSEDVFVTQTGPDERVLAYTNPVCKNTDVIGIVTCDPPSGAKIGMNVTEIVCTCTHSDNVVDTCEIRIPDVTPYENCSGSDFVCGSKAVSITCAPVTALGIFLGIFIGTVIGGTVTLIVIALLKKKYNRKQPTHAEGNPESCKLMSTTANSKKSESILQTSREQNEEHTKPKFTTYLQPHMTIIQGEPLQLKCSFHGYPIPTILWYKDGTQLDPEAGYKTTSCEEVAMLTSQSTKEGDEGMFSCVAVNPEGDDITSCNVLVEISTVMVQPSDDNCTLAEVRSDVTDKGLPCANPDESGKTAVDTPACKHDENLTVGFHEEDLSTSPKPPLDPLNGEVTKDVADTVALPLRIKCLKCGNSLCTIEVTGSEWCEK